MAAWRWSAKGTAALLVTLARQAQAEGGRERSPVKRRALSITEWQENLVAGVPGVGPALARRLLTHLGSFAALVHADVRTLREVEGIGPRCAQTLVGLFSARYGLARSSGVDEAELHFDFKGKRWR